MQRNVRRRVATFFFVNTVYSGPRVRERTNAETLLMQSFFRGEGDSSFNYVYDQLSENIEQEKITQMEIKMKTKLNMKTLLFLCESLDSQNKQELEYKHMRKIEDARPNNLDLTNDNDKCCWSNDILEIKMKKIDNEENIMMKKILSEVIEDKIRKEYCCYSSDELQEYLKNLRDNILKIEELEKRFEYCDVIHMLDDDDCSFESEHESTKKRINTIGNILILKKKKLIVKYMLAEEIVCQKKVEYMCPISHIIMRDPVRTKNGNCYERNRYKYANSCIIPAFAVCLNDFVSLLLTFLEYSILQHIQQRKKGNLPVNDPLTNEILHDTAITSDQQLRSNIEKAIEKVVNIMDKKWNLS